MEKEYKYSKAWTFYPPDKISVGWAGCNTSSFSIKEVKMLIAWTEGILETEKMNLKKEYNYSKAWGFRPPDTLYVGGVGGSTGFSIKEMKKIIEWADGIMEKAGAKQ